MAVTVRARAIVTLENIQRDSVSCDGMPDGTDVSQLARNITDSFFSSRFETCLSSDAFDVWKFPQVRIDHSSRALPHEDMAVVSQHERRESTLRRASAGSKIWNLVRAAASESEAQNCNRAIGAFRLARNAD